jgi:3-methyladenine DNA glycosylase AlkD
MNAKTLQQRLLALADAKGADSARRFFKTGAGESGEGLRFLGLGAAKQHALAKEFRALPLHEIEAVLHGDWHEERTVALLILTLQYSKADIRQRQAIYDLYLANLAQVNSWALVDCSAPHIVGAHLFDKNRKPLDRLAKSKSLWQRRIAIIATQHFIRKGEFADTLRIAEKLRKDKEDLIHKAVGWMLREVGGRDRAALEAFLKPIYQSLPRTMLRYAIEKFEPTTRKAYLQGTIE